MLSEREIVLDCDVVRTWLDVNSMLCVAVFVKVVVSVSFCSC